jgi:hypothetical protein
MAKGHAAMSDFSPATPGFARYVQQKIFAIATDLMVLKLLRSCDNSPSCELFFTNRVILPPPPAAAACETR